MRRARKGVASEHVLGGMSRPRWSPRRWCAAWRSGESGPEVERCYSLVQRQETKCSTGVDGDGYSRWVVLARLVVAQGARLGEEANDECTDSVRGWKRRGWPGVAAMESGSVLERCVLGRRCRSEVQIAMLQQGVVVVVGRRRRPVRQGNAGCRNTAGREGAINKDARAGSGSGGGGGGERWWWW